MSGSRSAKMPDCDSGAETKTLTTENTKLIFFLFHFLIALPAKGLKVMFLIWKWPPLKPLCLHLVGGVSDFFIWIILWHRFGHCSWKPSLKDCSLGPYKKCGKFTNTQVINAFFFTISHVSLFLVTRNRDWHTYRNHWQLLEYWESPCTHNFLYVFYLKVR